MQTVELKAWQNGLLKEWLLTIPSEGTWDTAKAQIETLFEERKISGAGRIAQVTVDFGTRAVGWAELSALVEEIKQKYGLLVVAVIGTDATTHETARQLALNTYLMQPGNILETPEQEPAAHNALYVPTTLRSGQRVVHAGAVIVAGDVNAGAEVIAAGDIVVFGTLRGLAHAGSQGDEKARILAGSMRPPQLRIAAKIARAPEDANQTSVRTPEVARIENGEIQVSPA